MTEETKKCMFCGEEILQIAVKCRHCGSDLNETRSPSIKQENGEMLGIFLLIVPFISVLLMWFWAGEMNLLQSPGSKLNFIAIGTIILTGIIAAIEANQLGFGKNTNKSGKMSETGPAGYFFGFVLLWIVVYPLYLYQRSKKNRKNLVFGGILIALIFLASYIYINNIIDERISELSNTFSKNISLKTDNKSENDVSDNDKLTGTLREMKTIATAIEMYRIQVQTLPEFTGTLGEAFAKVPALAQIAGNQRITRDNWGNDFIIKSNRYGDSYAIGSAGRDGVFKGWAQDGLLLSESDFDQDIIYSDGTYVTDPKKNISNHLFKKKIISNDLYMIKGTLYFAGETCFLSNAKGESYYLRNLDKIMNEIKNKNMIAKPVLISGIQNYKNEQGSIYCDVSSSTVEIKVEKPIKSWEGILEGKIEQEDSIYLVTKDGTFYVDIIDHVDKKSIWEKIYKKAASQKITKIKGTIEEYSNGNKFIYIIKLF